MAQSRIFPISSDFNFKDFMAKFVSFYQSKGYFVNLYNLGAGVCAQVTKGDGGINKIAGLVEGVTVNFIINDGNMVINFTDEKWVDKIIALVLGWLCCAVTWITGGIGAYRQSQLTNNIANDIQMLIGSTGF